MKSYFGIENEQKFKEAYKKRLSSQNLQKSLDNLKINCNKNKFSGIHDKKYYENLLGISDDEINVLSNKYIYDLHKYEEEFSRKTSLTHLDIKILIVTAGLQVLRWYLVSNDKGRFDKASDADKFVEGLIPASWQDILSHQVPYDVVRRSLRFKAKYPYESVGLSGSNHRYATLGHDPIAGWIVGTANIATNTLCVNEMSKGYPSYCIRNNEIDDKTDIVTVFNSTIKVCRNNPEIIGASFLKQTLHYSTDVFTKMGLPMPIVNIISPETSKFLMSKGVQIDLYSVSRGIMLATLINNIVAMFHRLYMDPQRDDVRLYDVRTRKILTYSNILSSVINVSYVAGTKDFKRLDVGGILVTLWRIMTDEKIVRKIKYDFIRQCIDNEFVKEEDKINQKLAKLGYQI